MNDDLRLVVHRTPGSLPLAWVDHHEAAYARAERRRIQRHPATGAMQIVEVRERVDEVRAPAPQPGARPALFDDLRRVELMAFGVPEDWVDDVRAADEDSASSSGLNLGRRWGSTWAGARRRCGSTTAPRTRPALTPTGCCRRR